jgi:hypothetical protein
MNSPAFASACRPAARCAFHMGHAWIISGQISRVTATPAAAAKRVESSSRGSHEPTWISVGGSPRRSANSGETRGSFLLTFRWKIGLDQPDEISPVNDRIDIVLGGERRSGKRQVGPCRDQPGTARNVLSGIAEPVDQRYGETTACAVPADRDLSRGNAFLPRNRQAERASSSAAGKGCSGASRYSIASVRALAAVPASVTRRRWLRIDPD